MYCEFHQSALSLNIHNTKQIRLGINRKTSSRIDKVFFYIYFIFRSVSTLVPLLVSCFVPKTSRTPIRTAGTRSVSVAKRRIGRWPDAWIRKSVSPTRAAIRRSFPARYTGRVSASRRNGLKEENEKTSRRTDRYLPGQSVLVDHQRQPRGSHSLVETFAQRVRRVAAARDFLLALHEVQNATVKSNFLKHFPPPPLLPRLNGRLTLCCPSLRRLWTDGVYREIRSPAECGFPDRFPRPPLFRARFVWISPHIWAANKRIKKKKTTQQ